MGAIYDRFGTEIKPGDTILYALGCGRSSGCISVYRVLKAETYEDQEWGWIENPANPGGNQIKGYKTVTKERLSARELDPVGEYTEDPETHKYVYGPPWHPRKAVALRDSGAAVVVTGMTLGPRFVTEMELADEADRNGFASDRNK